MKLDLVQNIWRDVCQLTELFRDSSSRGITRQALRYYETRDVNWPHDVNNFVNGRLCCLSVPPGREATSHHYTQKIFSGHKGRKIDEGTTDVMRLILTSLSCMSIHTNSHLPAALAPNILPCQCMGPTWNLECWWTNTGIVGGAIQTYWRQLFCGGAVV